MPFTPPTPTAVAAVLRARTRGPNSEPGGYGDEELGAFTAETRPTLDEVSALIAYAATLTLPRLGAVPTVLEEMATSIVTLRAAMAVELSYWPEQASGDQGIYAQLRTEYVEALAAWDLAAKENAPGDSRVASVRTPTVLSSILPSP